MRRLSTLLLLITAPAVAQTHKPLDDGKSQWDDGDVKIRHVEVGATLFGFVSGSFLGDDVDNLEMTLDLEAQLATISYTRDGVAVVERWNIAERRSQ